MRVRQSFFLKVTKIPQTPLKTFSDPFCKEDKPLEAKATKVRKEKEEGRGGRREGEGEDRRPARGEGKRRRG